MGTGQTYQLFGPKEYTYTEAFAHISQILGRHIRYEQISYEAYYGQLLKIRSPFFAQHIVEVAKDHGNGVLSGTNNVIEQITGHPQ